MTTEELFMQVLELMPVVQAGNRLPDDSLPLKTFRRLPEALKYEYIQINNKLTNIFAIDIDDKTLHAHFLKTGEVPDYTVGKIRPLGLTFTRSGGVHVFYRVKTIGGSDAATMKARIVREALTLALGGDILYENRTARNPFLRPERTIWFEDSDIYSVSDIEDELKRLGLWRTKPRAARKATGYGWTDENSMVFNAVKAIMKEKTTAELSVLDTDAALVTVREVNDFYGAPLDGDAMKDMAERMAEYWSVRPGADEWSVNQKSADRGRKGGMVNTAQQQYQSMKNLEMMSARRQEKAIEVYDEFMSLLAEGVSTSECARRLPVSLATLKRWKRTPPTSWTLTEAPERPTEAVLERRMIKIDVQAHDKDEVLSDDDFAAALGVTDDLIEEEFAEWVEKHQSSLSHEWTFAEWCDAKSWNHFIPTVRNSEGTLQLFAGMRGSDPQSPGGRKVRDMIQDRYERALAALPAGAALPPVLEAIEMGFFCDRLLNFLPRKQPRKSVVYPVMRLKGDAVTFWNAENCL